jgi:hypothetical protein
MIVMKSIKPSQFLDKAVYAELLKGMKEFTDRSEAEFKSTVKDWNHQPDFEKIVKATTGAISGKVETDDQVYNWVSEGTKDHRVPKEGTATMAFPSAYSPKTSSGRIPSTPGGASGPIIIRTGAWMVKGIKARKYDVQIGKKLSPVLTRIMNVALARGTKASGHAI